MGRDTPLDTHADVTGAIDPAGHWVFGYGSLMWNPGFPYQERHRARLIGYNRAFCIYSTHHRGSHEKPGLVLGLDRGGVCHGWAYRIGDHDHAAVMRYLRAREQVSGVYREAHVRMEIAGDDHETLGEVDGVAYVVEPCHPGYAGRLPVATQAHLIRAARGLSGPNVEYLVNTHRQLIASGIRDRNIERVLTAVGGLFASRGTGGDLKRACEVLLGATRYQAPLAPRLRRHQRRRFMHRLKLDALKA
jgi:cation transport protein ChaC